MLGASCEASAEAELALQTARRGADLRLTRSLDGEQAQAIALEDAAGETPGPVGARVQVDAVLAHLGGRHLGVAVHDDLAEILGGAQEFVADRLQVDRL